VSLKTPSENQLLLKPVLWIYVTLQNLIQALPSKS